MDEAGVDLSVLSLNPPGVQMFSDAGKATELAQEANETLVRIIKGQPGRFWGLASLAPQDPDAAAREVKRAMGPLGLGGILIGSHTHGHYLDEPASEPISAAFEEEDATLYPTRVHPARR